jgi:hypothetical protein
MQLAIVLSLAACFCTATGSVCQRLGATNLEQSRAQAGGFDPWLVFRLARQSAWLLGFACMIAGFVFQVAALRFGPLALVQPILAVELLFVFGWLALLPGLAGARASRRDWLALAITASFGYTSAAWAEVAGLIRAGKIHLAPVITHRFPLEAFPDAYRTLREAAGPRGKVLLEVNPA